MLWLAECSTHLKHMNRLGTLCEEDWPSKRPSFLLVQGIDPYIFSRVTCLSPSPQQGYVPIPISSAGLRAYPHLLSTDARLSACFVGPSVVCSAPNPTRTVRCSMHYIECPLDTPGTI